MAAPFYLEAPQGEEYKPSIGDRLGKFWDDTPPEAFFSLAQALSKPGPFLRNLTGGLSGFGQEFQSNKKRKGLASAFDSMSSTIPENMRPIFAAMQNDPEMQRAMMGGFAGQMFAKPAETWKSVDANGDGRNDFQQSSISGEFKAMPETLDEKMGLRRAGASNTNVTVAGEKAFEKGAGEFQAKAFGDMATSGLEAKGQLSQINALESSLAGTPGGWKGGLQGVALSWGVPIGKGADEAQLARSIISKLVPAQRPPGTGQMSDADLALFKDSLPKLINTPGGNQLIIGTMKAMAQFKLDQAKIASAALTGQITRQQAQEAMINLPDPMEQFKARSAGTTVKPDARKVLKWNPSTGTVE